MSISKMTALENFTAVPFSEDPEVRREWTDTLGRQQALLSEASSRDELEFQIFREIESRLTRRCAELEAEVQNARASRNQESEQTARNEQSEIEIARIRQEFQNYKSASMKREMEARENNKILAAALKAREEECAVLTKICSAERLLSELNAEEEKSRQIRSIDLEKRAERLRRYSEALNTEKKWIRETAARMEEEIRCAATLHPLRDYLNLTEREVTRVEIDLKCTPTSSPNRNGLEECFAQLIAQREFLRSVITASVKESESRAEVLAKIQRDAQAAPPVPPLPTLLKG